METIYLTCVHDRHTDDKYKAFGSEKAAKHYIKELVKQYKWDCQVTNNYGDWCLYLTDDYYMFVQKIELWRRPPGYQD